MTHVPIPKNLRLPHDGEKIATGPIDDYRLYQAAVACPHCLHEEGSTAMLWYTSDSEQGPCHSGHFYNRMLRDCFSCEECDLTFVYDDVLHWEPALDWKFSGT